MNNTYNIIGTDLVRGDGGRDHGEVDDVRVKVECALREGVREARVVLQLLDECSNVILTALDVEGQVVRGVEAEGRPTWLED